VLTDAAAGSAAAEDEARPAWTMEAWLRPRRPGCSHHSFTDKEKLFIIVLSQVLLEIPIIVFMRPASSPVQDPAGPSICNQALVFLEFELVNENALHVAFFSSRQSGSSGVFAGSPVQCLFLRLRGLFCFFSKDLDCYIFIPGYSNLYSVFSPWSSSSSPTRSP